MLSIPTESATGLASGFCQLTARLSSTVHLWHGEHHGRARPFPDLVRLPNICSFIHGMSSRQAVTGHRAKCGTVKSLGSLSC